jgi:hypothetical protein
MVGKIYGEVRRWKARALDHFPKELVNRLQRAMPEVDVVVSVLARVEVTEFLIFYGVPQLFRLLERDDGVVFTVNEQDRTVQLFEHCLIFPQRADELFRHAAEQVARYLGKACVAALHHKATWLLFELLRNVVRQLDRRPRTDRAAVPYNLRHTDVELKEQEVKNCPGCLIYPAHPRLPQMEAVS